MLLHAVLNEPSPVPHGAEVGVDFLDHLTRTVAELPRDCEWAHRSATVEGLEPGRAVGVPEHFRANLAPLPPCPNRYPIQGPAPVRQHRLPAGDIGRKQEIAAVTSV